MSTVFLPAPATWSHPLSGISTTRPTSPRIMDAISFCCVALMAVTFALPGISGPITIGSLDTLALLKLGTRLLAGSLLAVLLLCQTRVPGFFRCVAVLTPLFAFVGWAFATSLWSPLKSTSAGQAFGLGVLMLLTLNIAVHCRTAADANCLIRRLSCGLLIYGMAIIGMHIAFPKLCSLSRFEDGMIHPTAAAATASLGILLVVAARGIWGWTWAGMLILPAIAVHGTLLMLAANRTALFATVLIGGLLLLRTTHRAWIAVTVVAVCSIVPAYLALNPGLSLVDDSLGTTLDYIERDNPEDITHLSGRTEMWEAIWKSHLTSPWLGHGYAVSSSTGRIDVWGESGNWTAHNIILQSLVSTGRLGTLLFLLGCLVPTAWLVKHLLTKPAARRPVGFFLAFAAWLVIWGMFNESLLGPLQPESVVLVTVLGIGIGMVIPRVDTGSDTRVLPDPEIPSA